MRKSILISTLTLTFGLVSSNTFAQNTDWGLFSKGLIGAVNSGNHGAKLGAMQQIAIYGSNLDVDRTVFDIVRVYRNSKNENERILALSALAKIQDSWAMDFLTRSVRFEKSKRVRHHTVDVLNAYHVDKQQSASLTMTSMSAELDGAERPDVVFAMK